MIRESDEDCLALIAEIRDKSLNAGFHDIERLLANLEARIAERQPVWRAGYDRAVAQRSPNAASFTSDITPAEMPRTMGPPQQADCPCGTETCREAWRELRQAKADEADEEDAATQAEAIRAMTAGVVRFRDVIREEVAEATKGLPEILREAVLAEVSVVWKDAVRHEIAGPILERRIGEVGIKEAIREEVAAEVARQLAERKSERDAVRSWVSHTQHEIDKLRAALEAQGP